MHNVPEIGQCKAAVKGAVVPFFTQKQTQIATAIARIKVARQKSGELRRENDQMIEQLDARARSTVDPEADKREDRAKAEEERRQSTPQHD